MAYQDFCNRYEQLCKEVGRAEAARMFDEDPSQGSFGPGCDE